MPIINNNYDGWLPIVFIIIQKIKLFIMVGTNINIRMRIFNFLSLISKINEEININIGINTKIIYLSVKIGVLR